MLSPLRRLCRLSPTAYRPVRSGIAALLVAAVVATCTVGVMQHTQRAAAQHAVSRATHVPAISSTGIESRPTSGRTRGLRTAGGAKVNVVEVLLDDMRVDDLAYAPNVRHVLAADGITERNMFSSYPLCCPARASFYSGLLPHNHHVYSVDKPYAYQAFDDRSTIATSLHSVGYSTGFVGKYLNGYGDEAALAPRLNWLKRHPGRTLSQAPKVESQDYVPAGWDQWYAGISGTYCKPACGGEYNFFNYAYTHNGHPRASRRGEYSSQVMGQQADHLIRRFHGTRTRTGKPFFLSVNFVAPHVGAGRRRGDTMCHYTTDSGHRVALESTAAPAWAYQAPAVAGITRGAGVLRDGTTEPGIADKPGSFAKLPELNASAAACVRRTTRDRAAAVYATDHYIGRMVATLKQTHEWDNTVFVFWSDNGYFQGEHHRMSGKIIPYEPVSRVPLIVTGPGIRGGAHDGVYGGSDRYAPMTVVDLSRTLEAIAGARTPHNPDGKDMEGVLTGPDTGWNEAVPLEFAVSDPRLPGNHHRDPGFAPADGSNVRRGVRGGLVDPRTGIGLHTGRYYYLRYADGEKELYDVWADPNEWNNLMADRAWVRGHGSLLAALNSVWNTTKNCTGSACYPTLPTALAVDRAQNTAQWSTWWRTMNTEYGDNHPPVA